MKNELEFKALVEQKMKQQQRAAALKKQRLTATISAVCALVVIAGLVVFFIRNPLRLPVREEIDEYTGTTQENSGNSAGEATSGNAVGALPDASSGNSEGNNVSTGNTSPTQPETDHSNGVGANTPGGSTATPNAGSTQTGNSSTPATGETSSDETNTPPEEESIPSPEGGNNPPAYATGNSAATNSNPSSQPPKGNGSDRIIPSAEVHKLAVFIPETPQTESVDRKLISDFLKQLRTVKARSPLYVHNNSGQQIDIRFYDGNQQVLLSVTFFENRIMQCLFPTEDDAMLETVQLNEADYATLTDLLKKGGLIQ